MQEKYIILLYLILLFIAAIITVALIVHRISENDQQLLEQGGPIALEERNRMIMNAMAPQMPWLYTREGREVMAPMFGLDPRRVG